MNWLVQDIRYGTEHKGQASIIYGVGTEDVFVRGKRCPKMEDQQSVAERLLGVLAG